MYGENWNVVNNELHGHYSLVMGGIYNEQADLILKDQYQVNGNWQASIDFIRTVDDEFPDYYAAQAIFSLWQDFDHKIQISVGDGGDNWGEMQDSISFGVQVWDGYWSWAETSTNKVKFNWDPDTWHTASLEKRGNIYSLFVDDACIGHYIDNYLYGQGKIGLHTYGTRRLDNFILSPIYCTSEFSDNFSENLSNWTDIYGDNWSIQNSELHGYYSLGAGGIYDEQADLILNDQYQIIGNWQASIDFTRTADDQFPDYYAAQAMFSLWQDFDHKIQISVGDGGDYWGDMQDSISFGVQVWDGYWSWAETSTNKVKFNWDPDTWHTASLEKRGNIYSLFVDDACIGHYIDNFLNGLGKVGLHTYGTRRLDNFILETCTNLNTGVSDNEQASNDFEILIQPNPCSSNLLYVYHNENMAKERYNIYILNIFGVLIKTISCNNQDVISIDVSDFSSGIYFLNYQSDDYHIAKAFIIN